MPKSIISLSVDTDVWLMAKQRIDNISGFFNEILKNYLTNEETIDSKDVNSLSQRLSQVNNSISELAVKKSIMEMEIKLLAEQKEEELKNAAKKKEYDRWKCPVCSKINFLDNDRCINCGLPTKDSSKTVIINLKDENAMSKM